MEQQNNQTTKRPLFYLAGPLFSQAERDFNLKIKNLLKAYVDVYLPQEDGGLLVDMISKGVPPDIAAQRVFETDKDALSIADFFIIILDGRAIDEGAAFELGCAYTLGKPCYGLKTDPRQLLKHGDNPMIQVPLERIFYSISELESWARDFSKQQSLASARWVSGIK